jgi:hypothetical protein
VLQRFSCRQFFQDQLDRYARPSNARIFSRGGVLVIISFGWSIDII